MKNIGNFSNEDTINEIITCGYEAAIVFNNHNLIQVFITSDFLNTIEVMQQQNDIIEMDHNHFERFFSIYTYNWDDSETLQSLLTEQQIDYLQSELINLFLIGDVEPHIRDFFLISESEYCYLEIDITTNGQEIINLYRWDNQICLPQIVRQN